MTSEDTKEGGKKHGNRLGWKDQNKIADKSINATWRDKSKDTGKKKKT